MPQPTSRGDNLADTMPETIADLRDLPRPAAYAELSEQVHLVLEGIVDPISGMSTISALVHWALGFLWTGFYRVVEPGELMRIGPYQGSLGCLEIAFGKGVCGKAAKERRTIIVDDVNLFPSHIACDVRSRSEIVVPVLNHSGELIAVLDVDSEKPHAFNDEDRAGLEEIVRWFQRSV